MSFRVIIYNYWYLNRIVERKRGNIYYPIIIVIRLSKKTAIICNKLRIIRRVIKHIIIDIHMRFN